ncbi:TetR/AcrR family transcriptional regulator [Actinomadura livida]|uniref:AcrR family transcriptional regulator n=1 Tax=Actinomadura livida TaxID=79909 RepID=A0A7W7IJ23_9ACTN|nr:MULTISPECIES: TetR/AcrR family transcriptional regulator [Actinomadura]MBB4778031.1 AcrR family transcriptional regulator [Actinomadura catellatispora]GGT97078.1 TetR family transcriptional regulator [Actinomadura livida]
MAARTARERVRAELIREITDIARRQLGTEGAAGLSLRAVAREMGMVSSAIYRYFPSRDDLLTALIIDGYNAVGEAVEQADAGTPADDFAGRWLAVCRAVREWALAHPHEYALLYGSPVPGYKAPDATVSAAARDTVVFARIVSAAHAAGAIDPAGPLPPPPPSIAEDLARVRAAVDLAAPDDVVVRALTAWAGLYGTVSFELFGQFANTVEDDRAAYFDHTMTLLGRLVGLKS